MKYLYKMLAFILMIFMCAFSLHVRSQTCEWKLTNPTYSAVDPDGAGPATGSVTFTLQIHTISGTIAGVNDISTGWSFLSTDLMVPTTPGCSVVSSPPNVSVSSAFTSGGFTYSTVNQCNLYSQTTGGQNFDTRAVGTLDGTSIDITTTWMDVFTVTMWTLNNNPQYVIINSSDGGTPSPFSSYAVADNLANQYSANSLTFDTPLLVGPAALPVQFTKLAAQCTNAGTMVSWSTASEFNSSYFELERSNNGNNNWTPVASVNAAGNSSSSTSYQQLDPDFRSAYYRIKQVNTDGSFIYTNIISSNCATRNIDMVLYPVPAKDILNVMVKATQSAKTKLAIIDGLGRTVQVMDITLTPGNNTFQFNLKGLANGEYLIQSNAPGAVLNKKFNIIR